ncbi:MAG: membrane-binding protein [Leptospira sp.]|nr:membrane-binding protein [Leptospira sp.]
MNNIIKFKDKFQLNIIIKKHRKFALLILCGTILLATYLIIVFFLKSQCVYGNCNTGFGVMQFRDGSAYSGGFLNGKFSDYGTISLPNGEKYEGGWHRGQKSGKGVYTYSDGSIYDGQFRQNKKYGKGLFTWPDQTKLESNFIDGEPEGLGILTLPYPEFKPMSGVYKGGIIFSGEGIFIYDDGSRYIGSWKGGKENGNGIKLSAEGTIIERGIYENGNLISSEESTQPKTD